MLARERSRPAPRLRRRTKSQVLQRCPRLRARCRLASKNCRRATYASATHGLSSPPTRQSRREPAVALALGRLPAFAPPQTAHQGVQTSMEDNKPSPSSRRRSRGIWRAPNGLAKAAQRRQRRSRRVCLAKENGAAFERAEKTTSRRASEVRSWFSRFKSHRGFARP